MNKKKMIVPGKWYLEFDENGAVTNAVYEESYRRLLGYDPEVDSVEAWSNWTERLHPEDVQRVLAYADECLSGISEEDYDIEYRMMTKWGYRWFHDYGIFTRRENGSIARCDGVLFDIQDSVDREKIQYALAENNSRVLALEDEFESLYDVDLENENYEVYIKGRTFGDINTRLVNSNSFFTDTRNNVAEVVYPDDREAVNSVVNADFLREKLKQENYFDFYYRLLANGKPLWTRMRFVYKNSEKRNLIIGVFNAEKEIAEKQQAEKEREELIATMSGYAEAIYIVNTNTSKCRIINQKETKKDCLKGGSYAKFIKNYIESDVFGPDREKAADSLSLSEMICHLENENDYTVRYRVMRTGTPLWFEMHAVKLSDTEIIYGFTNRHDEIIAEGFKNIMYDDQFEVYVIDLDSEMITVQKASPWDDTYKTGDCLPYKRVMTHILENISSDSDKHLLYEKLNDIDSFRRDFAGENKRTYTYKSADLNKWVSAAGYIIARHDNGTPSVAVLCFSLLDAFALTRQELDEKEMLANQFINNFIKNYDLVFKVNSKDDSYTALKMDNKMAGSNIAFKNFSDALNFMLNELVYSADKKELMKKLDARMIRQELKQSSVFRAEYRVEYNGILRWDEMTINVLDNEYYVVGFNLNNGNSIIRRHLHKKEYDNYYALFSVDLDAGLISVIKNDSWYVTGNEGDTAPYNVVMKSFADALKGKAKEIFTRFSDVDELKLIHEKEDKYTYSYQSIAAEGKRWVTVTSYVIVRHDDGSAAVTTLGFNIMDSMGAQMQDMSAALQENMETIGGLASRYMTLYYVNLKAKQFKIYSLDKNKYPESYQIACGSGDPFKKLRQFVKSDIVYPEDRRNFAEINDVAFRKRLAHSKNFTVRFRYKSSKDYRWAEMDVVKAENVDEPANVILIGFADRNDEIRKEINDREKLAQRTAVSDYFIKSFASAYYCNIKTGEVIVLQADPIIAKLAENVAMLNYDKLFTSYIDSYVAPDDRETVKENLSIEHVAGQLENMEDFSFTFRDISDCAPGIYRCTVIRGADPEHIGIGFRNITELLAEQESQQNKLQNALEEARTASKAKTDFLFNMSHDIRTPMNAIMGFTNMALKHIDDKERVADSLTKAREAGGLLLSLINDILDMSRVESGKINIEENEGDVYLSFATIESTMRELAKAKNIRLNFEFSKIENRYVYADLSRCVRIFVNIITNSIKYTHDGGRVNVRCEQIGKKDNIGIYRYTFEDNGIGMSEEFQKFAFDEFTRENTATVSGIQGTGLGLAVCKSFVKAINGTIECVSTQGEGSIFTVILPFRLQEGKMYTDPHNGKVILNSVAEQPNMEISFRNKKVLLVEDNELNREIAVDILSEVGMIVDTAGDGSGAVEMLRKKGPLYYDCILMDIQMPIMNGYEATREIREMYPRAGIPIIALSANAFEEDKLASLTAGMNDHIAKPINPDELFVTLKKYL